MSVLLEKPAKVKWRPRRSTLPETLICSQAEAMELLRRQVFDDAVAAGWLSPCATRATERDAATKIYAVSEVQAVARRILAGEYPGAVRKGKGGEA